MGHITSRNHYENLVAKLNRFPQGAPPSETLYKLLSVLSARKKLSLSLYCPFRHLPLKSPQNARE
jgi:hypothetical protein